MTRYTADPSFRHDKFDRVGVLLTNLGTPDAPTTGAVRRYLAEFLWDPRIVELPRPLWWLILHGFILRVRPARSARAYQAIWAQRGSPLLLNSQRQALSVGIELEKRFAGPVSVSTAMRYGNPSIAEALRSLREKNLTRLLVLPLFPQYSGSTTGSTFDAVSKELQTWRRVPELRFVAGYHDDPGYVDAIVHSVRRHWHEKGRGERLLLSFHGLPKRFLLAGDPYHCQCHKTARLVAESLGLSRADWEIGFQSRFGREEWLKPYTDDLLRGWAAYGVKRVDVVCPGFSADCLETLEEVAIGYRELFLEAGGESLDYIPALNASAQHIGFLVSLIERQAQGWPEMSLERDMDALKSAYEVSAQRAISLGAER